MSKAKNFYPGRKNFARIFYKFRKNVQKVFSNPKTIAGFVILALFVLLRYSEN